MFQLTVLLLKTIPTCFIVRFYYKVDLLWRQSEKKNRGCVELSQTAVPLLTENGDTHLNFCI